MDLGIAGRKAIVCASSKGLGRACAEALAEAGCTVVINGRNGAAVKATAAAIRAAYGVEAIEVVADVGTAKGQASLIKACPDADILVNNNGGPPPADYATLSRDALLTGVTQNMVTPIELIQKLAPGMAARGFGRIVNITSSSVLTPLPGLDLSSGARAGLTAFLAGVARQLAPQGVTINHILPGSFSTERMDIILNNASAASGRPASELLRERAKAVPVGRFGYPEEFGKLCAFLCSAHAGYITGQNLLIDGGAFRSAF